MRIALALVVLSSPVAGCCCRRTCCPPPVRAAARPPQPLPVHPLPAGTLEATLHYARGRAAARTSADTARKAYEQALAVLGEEPAPARVVVFRSLLHSRLAGAVPSPIAPADPAQVQVFDVSDLIEVMKRMPFPRIEIVGPEGTRLEEPISLLGTLAMEQMPNYPAGTGAPTLSSPNGTDLVVKAIGTQQDAIRDALLAFREVWPLLWPAATS